MAGRVPAVDPIRRRARSGRLGHRPRDALDVGHRDVPVHGVRGLRRPREHVVAIESHEPLRLPPRLSPVLASDTASGRGAEGTARVHDPAARSAAGDQRVPGEVHREQPAAELAFQLPGDIGPVGRGHGRLAVHLRGPTAAARGRDPSTARSPERSLDGDDGLAGRRPPAGCSGSGPAGRACRGLSRTRRDAQDRDRDRQGRRDDERRRRGRIHHDGHERRRGRDAPDGRRDEHHQPRQE